MAFENIHKNKRLWFYMIVLAFFSLIAAVFLISSSVFEEKWKGYNLRKIVSEIGYAFFGTTIFTTIAIFYEVFKDEEPEILSIIRTLNDGISTNVTFQNDLSPTQPSRSTEVVRMMRENRRNKVLERIRMRAFRAENGTNTSSLGLNHTEQVTQVNGNLPQELSTTDTVDYATQSSDISNVYISSEDATSAPSDRSVDIVNPFTSAISGSAQENSTVNQNSEMLNLRTINDHFVSSEMVNLGAIDDHSASSEMVNLRAIDDHSASSEMVNLRAIDDHSASSEMVNLGAIDDHSASSEMVNLRAIDDHSASSEEFNLPGSRHHLTHFEMVDLKSAAAVLYKSLPINAVNVTDLNSNFCHSLNDDGTDLSVCPHGIRRCRCKHSRISRI